MKAHQLGSEYGLNIRHPTVSPKSPHYRIPAWPPPDDWPVAVDADGRVVCRVSDSVWNFAVYGRSSESVRINFASGRLKVDRGQEVHVDIDSVNRRLFQQTMCWFLWGHRQRLNARTVVGYAARLKPVFLLCAKHQIDASDLYRFPRVLDQLANTVAPSTANEVLTMLRELWTVRDVLGFTILDERGLAHFEAGLPEHQEQQTPYIPPRIWLYQMQRLRIFLEDFWAHRDAIVAFFRYVHEACLDNMGSAEALYSEPLLTRSPFNREADQHKGCRYHGTFWEVADRFGVRGLLERWALDPADADVSWAAYGRLHVLSGYFRAAVLAGHKYLLNLSGVRANEGADFRSRCFEVERDPTYGDLYLLRGETSKTVKDDQALWVTSPSAKLAVDVMTTVATLRLECARSNPYVNLPEDEVADPWLLSRPREPWCSSGKVNGAGRASVKYYGYGDWESVCPVLFDKRELMITADDIRLARLVTPTLDPMRYAMGMLWHFHDHQLRRTTAVNMCASNLISEPTLQYQLKHMRRAQSLYYGRGFTRVALNRKYAEDFLRTAYEMLRRQITLLADDRYVSPLGEAHKINLLKRLHSAAGDEPLGKRDIGRIQKLVATGELAAKPTLLGLCLSPEPCEWGGVLNLIHCGKCDRALGDKAKLPHVCDVRQMIKGHLEASPSDSPDRASLELQLTSVETFIRVLQS
ncbi:Integrase [Rhodanobacter sp. Root179]